MKTVLRSGVCVVGLLMVCGMAEAAVYNIQLDVTKYGRADQANVDMPDSVTGLFGGGANSCVPTSIANGYRYLQQAYPAIYGTNLVPMSALATAADIGLNHTSTTSDLGTTGDNWIFGRQSYVQSVVPNVSRYGSTFGNFSAFIINWLGTERAAMEVGIVPTAGGIGHALTLTGFSWNDANNDNIIQQGENATLKLIDPFAPANDLSIPVWQVGATYNVTYMTLGYELVLATATVPTPAGGLLLAMGVFALGRRRR